MLVRDTAEYRGYVAEIMRDDATHIFQGRVLNIKAIVIFEAETLERAKQEFQKSIDAYLKFCYNIGKLPETSSSY
jgi:predicted HicB family RNase H-like nuclease